MPYPSLQTLLRHSPQETAESGILHILPLAMGAAVPEAISRLLFKAVILELDDKVCNCHPPPAWLSILVS